MKEKQNPLWNHGEIHVPDEILVPLVDHEMTPTISLSQLRDPKLRDPILEIVIGIEDPEQIVQKKNRQSLHQRGRDGHLRVNRFNDRNPRRTLGEKEEIIKTSEYKVSRRLFAFEETMGRISGSNVGEAVDQSESEENTIPAGSSREVQVRNGLWASTDGVPQNPVKIYPTLIDPAGSYRSILSEVADPETVELFVQDQLRTQGAGVEPSQYDNMIPSDVRKNTYPAEDSFGHNSHP